MKQIVMEKLGTSLKVEFKESGNGVTLFHYMNGNLIKEESHAGKDMVWAESAAQEWIDGVVSLNG